MLAPSMNQIASWPFGYCQRMLLFAVQLHTSPSPLQEFAPDEWHMKPLIQSNTEPVVSHFDTQPWVIVGAFIEFTANTVSSSRFRMGPPESPWHRTWSSKR